MTNWKRKAAAIALSTLCAAAYGQQKTDVLIHWKDGSITRTDYEAALQKLTPAQRFTIESSIGRINQVLDYLMINRRLAEEALAAGLDKQPLNAALLRQRRDQTLAQMEADSIRAKATLPDFTPVAREYYETHPQQFVIPEKVDVAHILIRTHNRTPEQAKALAEKIRTELLAGADFTKLEKKYSEDKVAQGRDGDLGWFQRGQMVKPFENAAFALKKVGDISPVVKTQFGYHIIKLLGRHAAGQKTFSEVKQQLIAKEKKEYLRDQVLQHVDQIRNRKDIEINKKAVDALLVKAPAIPANPKTDKEKPRSR